VRHLGELQVPAAAAAFDFSKSRSLRDWRWQCGQTVSPSSYVTPRFEIPAAAERGGGTAGEQQQQALLFDPEQVEQGTARGAAAEQQALLFDPARCWRSAGEARLAGAGG
jgi:hypothetical protein